MVAGCKRSLDRRPSRSAYRAALVPAVANHQSSRVTVFSFCTIFAAMACALDRDGGIVHMPRPGDFVPVQRYFAWQCLLCLVRPATVGFSIGGVLRLAETFAAALAGRAVGRRCVWHVACPEPSANGRDIGLGSCFELIV